MTKRKGILAVFTLALLTLAQTALCETVVIVHPSNSANLSDAEINKIFLGKSKSFPGGGTAVPVNQKEGSAIRSGFDEKVLGKSSSQIKSYWSKLLFTGKGTPPKELDSDAEVKSLVADNPAIIGYIDAASVDDSVKVVLSF